MGGNELSKVLGPLKWCAVLDWVGLDLVRVSMFISHIMVEYDGLKWEC